MRAAVPVILQHDLITARSVLAYLAGGDSSAYEQQSAATVEVTVEQYGGRYVLHAVHRDLATQAITPFADVDGPVAGGVVGLVDGVAKRIDSAAKAFPSADPSLIASYANALQSNSGTQRLADLRQIAEANPRFGPAQLALIGASAEAGSPDTVDLIHVAASNRNAFDPIDQVTFDTTADRILHAPLQKQTQAAAALARMAPNNLEALSILGTDEFLENNAAAGERDLQRTLQLTFGNAGISLQLAAGYVETRQFAKAASLLERQKDPASVTYRAVAELLAGNKDKADQDIGALFQARLTASDPVANLSRAEWIAASSGYRAGIATLENATWARPDLNAIALAQAAIWELASGNRPVAQATVQRAIPMASSGVAKAFTAAANALTHPGSAAELRQEFQNDSANTQTHALLAYGLFFYGDYSRALAEWQNLFAASGGADENARAMLAACAAKVKQPAAVTVQPFVPNLSGDDPFAAVAFNQMKQLIGR